MHGHRPKGFRTKQRETNYIESGFVCLNCGRPVTPNPVSSDHSNHCPWCLHSLHLDTVPGDQASCCRGIMEPVVISVRRDKEWGIIHRFNDCGALRENRIAGDDNAMALMSLAVRPVARPPFPLDGLLEK
jgi:ribosome biogenesis GTPase / thiamine phosphate phosphatase